MSCFKRRRGLSQRAGGADRRARRNTRDLSGVPRTFEVLTLETVRIAAEDNLVFAERIDHFVLRNGKRFDLPVNGVFELENGKIQRFSDYFNLPSFEGPSGLKL
jgi:limonene-1,2-epoxide hydrolase